MTTQNCISLIGMPGAGKSTIGKILANDLGYAFVDTDYLLESVYAMRLQELTEKLSHEEFLDAEAAMVCALQVKECVIATGGSVIYRANAMEFLASLGPVIHLAAPLSAICSRVDTNPERGIAFTPGKGLTELYEERIPIYNRYAAYTCDTGEQGAEECAKEIAAILSQIAA